MSTHTVLDADSTREKNARPVYLALRSLGAHFYLFDDPSSRVGYRLVVNTAGILHKERRELANILAREHGDGLLALLLSTDCGARSVALEGCVDH